MKVTTFSFCLLSTLCILGASQYYKSANPNSLPCTTDYMVNISNIARNNRTWIMGLIDKAYPLSSYPQTPAVTDTSKTLYYVQTVRTYLAGTFPTFKTMENHAGIAIPAGEHAHHMAYYDYFSHSGCCNDSPFDRMKAYVPSYSTMGENLWTSWSTPGYASWTCEQVLVDLIVDNNVPSLGHRTNHYGKDWTHVGVGFGGGLSGSWEKYYVTFNFGGNPGTWNTALISAKSLYLNHYVQNIACDNGRTFSGKSGVAIATCGTTSTGSTSTTSSSTPTTSTSTSTSTKTTTTSTTSTTTSTSTSTDSQIAANGTCHGNFFNTLAGYGNTLRSQATSSATSTLLNRLKSSYNGWLGTTPVTTWTAKNIAPLTLSLSLSQWACNFAKAAVLGTTKPSLTGYSTYYYVTGGVVTNSLDYQTLTLLNGGDSFYNSAFQYYGFATYSSGSNAVSVAILSASA